jgi:predicted RNA-binding protein YlqC (UPF0109 family)
LRIIEATRGTPPSVEWDEGREVTTMHDHDPNDLLNSTDTDDTEDIDDFDEAYDGDDIDDIDDEQPASAEHADGPVGELVELVRFMVSALVDDPETLTIRPEQFGQNVHIKVIVPEEDMGKVIGRQGRIARSMRTLLTIAASRKGLRASLDIDS